MTKTKKRKGFTLTELAIVIAVIAILIAVLVPTFTSLITSANESADEQAVKSMNTALATDEALNGRKTNPSEAMQVLKDYGYNVENYQALDSNNVIYWNSETNRTLLYSTSENAVIYPSDAASTYTNLVADNLPNYWYTLSTAYKTVTYDDTKTFAENVSALKDGETLQLTSDETVDCVTPKEETKVTIGDIDYTVTGINALMLQDGEDITIDLNGYTLTSSYKYTLSYGGNSYKSRGSLTLSNNSSLYLKNGTLADEMGLGGTSAVFYIESGSSITLEDVTVTSSGSVLQPNGDSAQVNVINSSITTTGVYCVATNANDVDNYGVIINLSNSTFTTTASDGDACAICLNVPGTMNITDCTVVAQRQGVVVRAGTAIITNTTITCTATYSGGNYYKDSDWDQGNEYPMAALIVGNRNGTYAGDATVTCYGVTLNQNDTTNGYYVYMYGGVDCNVVDGKRTTTGVKNKAILNYDSACNLGTITRGETDYTFVNQI